MSDPRMDGPLVPGAMDPGTPDDASTDAATAGPADDDVEFIFDVDGDTTGADPDSDDPAVNIRPHEKGHFT